LGLACAHLHWSPDVFWSATPHDLQATFDALEPKKSREGNFTQQLDRMTEDGDG
jgi:hypothetical protein